MRTAVFRYNPDKLADVRNEEDGVFYVARGEGRGVLYAGPFYKRAVAMEYAQTGVYYCDLFALPSTADPRPEHAGFLSFRAADYTCEHVNGDWSAGL